MGFHRERMVAGLGPSGLTTFNDSHCPGKILHNLSEETTPPAVLEERGMERGSARHSSLKDTKRAIINQTNTGTLSKAIRDGVECISAFPSVQIPSWSNQKATTYQWGWWTFPCPAGAPCSGASPCRVQPPPPPSFHQGRSAHSSSFPENQTLQHRHHHQQSY